MKAVILAALILAACAPDNSELLKMRAAKQDAEWLLLAAKEQIAEAGVQYADLLREFSEYQDAHRCVPKQ